VSHMAKSRNLVHRGGSNTSGEASQPWKKGGKQLRLGDYGEGQDKKKENTV